jgi:hypothetical protein
VLIVFAFIPEMRGQSKIDEFALSFSKATSPRAKLDLSINAIDQGMITRGCSVQQLDQMFGIHHARATPRKGGSLETGVVEFSSMPASPSNAIAAAHIGWYLAFEFDSSGFVQNYHLSNTHK